MRRIKSHAILRKLNEAMYVHKGVNRRIVRFNDSMDEVKRIINAKKPVR